MKEKIIYAVLAVSLLVNVSLYFKLNTRLTDLEDKENKNVSTIVDSINTIYPTVKGHDNVLVKICTAFKNSNANVCELKD